MGQKNVPKINLLFFCLNIVETQGNSQVTLNTSININCKNFKDLSQVSLILEPMLNLGPFFVHDMFQYCVKIHHDLVQGIIHNSPSFCFNITFVSCQSPWGVLWYTLLQLTCFYTCFSNNPIRRGPEDWEEGFAWFLGIGGRSLDFIT